MQRVTIRTRDEQIAALRNDLQQRERNLSAVDDVLEEIRAQDRSKPTRRQAADRESIAQVGHDVDALRGFGVQVQNRAPRGTRRRKDQLIDPGLLLGPERHRRASHVEQWEHALRVEGRELLAQPAGFLDQQECL